MRSLLIGSSGYVGGHLAEAWAFDMTVRKSTSHEISGRTFDLVVCAGLPAAKWQANDNPSEDWENVCALANVLQTVRAKRAVLVSTIDVFGGLVYACEDSQVDLAGGTAYGKHRAWFEALFRSLFSNTLVVRLPALFSSQLRKNLIYDLIHARTEYLENVNSESTYQFFNMESLAITLEKALQLGLGTLNLATEPVTAGEVAKVFGHRLRNQAPEVHYSMHTLHSEKFGRTGPYLSSKAEILKELAELADELSA